MKNNFFLFLFLMTSFASFCQKKPIHIASFITKDSIYLKFVLSDFEAFKNLLSEELKVTIVDLANSKSKVLNISSFKSRLEKNEIDKVKYQREIDILSGIIDVGYQDSTAKNYAYAMASIESSLKFSINLVSGSLLAFPRNEFSNKLIIRVMNGNLTEEKQINIQSTIQPKPSKLKGNVDLKKVAVIEWNSDSLNKDYLGYIIEKKLANGSFKNILEEPYVNFKTNYENKNKLAAFRDENVKPGNTYYYRIRGINYFGFLGPESNEVKIYIPVLTNAMVEIDTIKANGLNREFSIKLNRISDSLSIQVSRIEILKSDSINGPYYKILELKNPKENSTLSITIDKLSGDANYYKAFAFSKDNDTSYSLPYYFFTLDQEPPSIVKNLKGNIDSTGIVSLTWTENMENDILGYRIFRSNAKYDEFVEITTKLSISPNFKDTLTLNTLTNDVYYFIFAVDKNYNQGKNSDTLYLIKPDTIPPSTPFLIDLRKDKDKVFLEWENSISNDLKITYLLRYEQDNIDTVLRILPKQHLVSYLDSNFTPSVKNNYYLIAEDLAGNKSKSSIRSIIIEPGYRPEIKEILLNVDKSKKLIKLSWQSPNNEVYQYYIYRRKGSEEFRIIKTLENRNEIQTNSFEDKDIFINNTYEYMIIYITNDGFRSKKSNILVGKY